MGADIGNSQQQLWLPEDLSTDLFPRPYYETGARIHSNSWGESDNAYTLNSEQIDRFSFEHQDFLPIFAAGNAGTGGLFTVGAPATAKNCLTVGASESTYKSWEQVDALRRLCCAFF